MYWVPDRGRIAFSFWWPIHHCARNRLISAREMRMWRRVLLGRSSPRAIRRRTEIWLTLSMVAVWPIENASGWTSGRSVMIRMLIGLNVAPRAILNYGFKL